ncbi:MAG: hypothetical protein IPJ65_11405 [Archangiaceae bacterium]|nr:hypothetical protein [Archangiaceae bacterium]
MELSAIAQAVARDFEITDGRLSMEPLRFERWVPQMTALDAAEAGSLAPELAALAAKFLRLGADDAEPAVIQLGALIAVALGSVEEARATLDSAGVDASRFEKALITATRALDGASASSETISQREVWDLTRRK